MRTARSLKFCLPTLVLLTTVLLMGPARSALAVTSFDFVSSGGQFSIAGDTLSFGNGLTVSAASEDGVEDAKLIGVSILLTPIQLTGVTTSLPGGLTLIEIDNSVDYEISLFRAPADGGALLLSGSYNPGEFLAIGASGLISAPIENGLSQLVLTQAGINFASPVLDSLVSTSELIDFNATLSAAGQDVATRIRTGALVKGAVAGSVATVIPEPTTALLMTLGLGGLALVSRPRESANGKRNGQ